MHNEGSLNELSPWKNPRSQMSRGITSHAWDRWNIEVTLLAKEAAQIRGAAFGEGERMRKARRAFDAFLPKVMGDMQRIARIVCRKKSPPKWVDFEEVVQIVTSFAWWYMFVRVDGSGSVGFDFAKAGPGSSAAGAWLKWKVTHKAMKEISKLRGENQAAVPIQAKDDRGNLVTDDLGNPVYLIETGADGAPILDAKGEPKKKKRTRCSSTQSKERLSKTGELPDGGLESDVLERVAVRRQIGKFEKLCKTAREFAILQAIAQGHGDDRRVVAYLIETKVYEDPIVALRDVGMLVESFAKKFEAPKGRSKLAA